MGSRETLQLSNQIMDGYKIEALILSLSFIGWVALAGFIQSVGFFLFLLGVMGGVYLFIVIAALSLLVWIPLFLYILTTKAIFYEYVKESSQAIGSSQD